MTLTVVFGTIALIGIALIVWHKQSMNYRDWPEFAGVMLIISGITIVLINSIFWASFKKDNQIMLEQLAQEKGIIEVILNTGTDLDKIMIRQDIIEYNNRIIKIKINSKRFILKDYYDRDVDWDALELISWKD